jgi:hypothetical protein
MSSNLENDGLVGLQNDGLVGIQNNGLVCLQNDGLVSLENNGLVDEINEYYDHHDGLMDEIIEDNNNNDGLVDLDNDNDGLVGFECDDLVGVLVSDLSDSEEIELVGVLVSDLSDSEEMGGMPSLPEPDLVRYFLMNHRLYPELQQLGIRNGMSFVPFATRANPHTMPSPRRHVLL